MNKEKFLNDFKSRVAATRPTRWVRFGLVSALVIAWAIWMGNLWLALILLLLFDIYITGYIPFTWWKKSKSAAVRTVMSWVDAIVYALILVYFVFAFVGQNYQIPSSSLEKTLLTGDYLWVNKMVYGPRVPMTPVHFPLVHNKLPWVNTDSYLDHPSLGYKRLKGLRDVEMGDIVVFNFPAGDTVATRFEETPEYYEVLVRNYGWGEVNGHPERFGQVKYRPVDRRQNFVKRVVGLPGQRLRIASDTIYIDGQAQPLPENAQFNYLAAMSQPMTADLAHKYGITFGDVQLYPNRINFMELAQVLPGVQPADQLYILPMTAGMIQDMKADGLLHAAGKVNDIFDTSMQSEFLFPTGGTDGWTLSNYGGPEGILIPRKGLTVDLTPENWILYQRAIRNYEGHTDSWIDGDRVYVDGKPASTYTFAMDYYFMMGDNRDNSQDSRFWGFVPEDHIVGTPMIVLISFDKDRSLLNGGIRWNRILRSANPDK